EVGEGLHRSSSSENCVRGDGTHIPRFCDCRNRNDLTRIDGSAANFLMTPALDRRASIETTLQRAIAAHRVGNLTEAESQYRLVLTLDGRHFDAVHMLGIVQAQRGNLEDAERLLDDALTIRPDNADASFNRGNVQLQRRRFESALASF